MPEPRRFQSPRPRPRAADPYEPDACDQPSRPVFPFGDAVTDLDIVRFVKWCDGAMRAQPSLWCVARRLGLPTTATTWPFTIQRFSRLIQSGRLLLDEKNGGVTAR